MRKQLKLEDWSTRLQTLSSGNKGVKTLLEESGKNLAENLSFRNIEFDPANKGNDLIIALGSSENSLRHIVNNPKEIYLHQNSDGLVEQLEVVNSENTTTKLRFI